MYVVEKNKQSHSDLPDERLGDVGGSETDISVGVGILVGGTRTIGDVIVEVSILVGGTGTAIDISVGASILEDNRVTKKEEVERERERERESDA